MNIPISYIVLCFNDHPALDLTLKSLHNELFKEDEIILVDSSDNRDEAIALINSKSFNCEVKTFHINPNGVFPAYNYAIKKSSKKYIQKINSGDTLIKGSRKVIQKNLINHHEFPIHVYKQRTTGVGSYDLIFEPTANSLWPLQSIIAKKDIFYELGFYLEDYKYNADQNFFMLARKSYKFILFKEVLSTYDSFGISSGFNFKHCKEHFVLRRLQGYNHFLSFYFSFFSPFARITIEKFFGSKAAFFIKSKIFNYYKNINQNQ